MRSRNLLLWCVVACLAAPAALFIACSQKPAPVTKAAAVKPIGTPIQIVAPLGLPPVPIPADNPPTAETVALGRKLYYDTVLSVDNTVSCASCHDPKLGFSDGNQFSDGVRGQKGNRNSPPFSIPLITPRNSGMGERAAWSSKRKGLCRTRSKWVTPS